MVDVVYRANALAEVDKVADSCENIVKNNVLRNEFVSLFLDIFLKFVGVGGIFQNLAEYLERYLLVDSVFFGVEINIALDIDHAVAYDLCNALNESYLSFAALVGVILFSFNSNESVVNACLLDLASLVIGNRLACFSHYLARHGIYDRL